MSDRCPHCGNADAALIEDNNLPRSNPNFSLLCVKRVALAERSWRHTTPDPDMLDTDGKVKCGGQWCPSE